VAKKNQHSTLSEVAKLAGVGNATVSRVINGGHLVSPKTLTRVRDAIASLGYTPNQAARILKGDRTRTIGLVIPSIADPFFSSCAEAAQAVARAHDSLLIVLTTQNSSQIEIDSLNVLMGHRPDGLIIAPAISTDQKLRSMLDQIGIPAISIDRPIPKSSITSVVSDNCYGAKIATQHLIDHGYQRIACLTAESQLYTIRERIRGYRQAIVAAGLTPLLDTSIQDSKSAAKSIGDLLARPDPPDAILALKNSTTIYVFEALQRLNIPVPTAVALLGFDDFELASTVRPSISVVRQPMEDIGRVAAELLFNQLLEDGVNERPRLRPSRQTVMLPSRLILRHSCGCPISLD
jgi:LacI family transcriptional regulator